MLNHLQFLNQNIDRSVRFPSTIDIHEHKAPTDESVVLLAEMEKKAMESIVAKISETRPNRFSYNVFFTRIADIESIKPKGIVHITFKCNGKDYSRTCQCSSDILQLAAINGVETDFSSLDDRVKSYLVFEISILIAQVLLGNGNGQMQELLDNINAESPVKFDLASMENEMENI